MVLKACAIVLLFAAAVMAVDKPTPRTNAAETRQRMRSSLFVPDPLPKLETETYGSFEPEADVVAERVSYQTAYGLRVPAIVYRPKQISSSKMPGMVVVNGHGGDKYSWYAFYAGILYARAGAVVVTYDPIGEGERNAEHKDATRQHDRNIDPPEMARRMGGLMITDAMQAVSYLASRPDVDPKRIATVGYSMGSFVLALTCAVDVRINACVLAGGGNLDGPGGYWDSSTKKMCQAIPYQTLNSATVEPRSTTCTPNTEARSSSMDRPTTWSRCRRRARNSLKTSGAARSRCTASATSSTSSSYPAADTGRTL